MKLFLTFLLTALCCAPQFLSAQNQMDLPVTFDDTTVDYGLISFEGAASAIEADPEDANNMVARVLKDAAAQAVAGTTVTAEAELGFLNPIPFTTSATTMTVRVWSPDAGIPVRLKVENHNDPGQSVETEAMTTVAGAWETLTFNFANQATGTAAINLAFNYDKATIFFNFGVTGETAGEKNYYFDDMAFGVGNDDGNSGEGDGEGDDTDPRLPLDFESATIDYTFTGFGGGEVTRIDNPQSNGINTSGSVGQMVKNAGEVYGGATILLNSAIDFSNNKIFKVKVYSPRAGARLLLKVENSENADVFFEVEQTVVEANIWEELTFDFSAIAAASYQRLVLIFDLGTMGDGSADFTFLFDDIQLTSADNGGGGGDMVLGLPLDLESATIDYTFSGFGGGEVTRIDNPQSNGINTSGKVGQMVKNVGEVYGGASILLNSAIDFSSNKIFKAKVYSPRAGARLLLKVENAQDAGVFFEVEQTVVEANVWEELTFDFSAIDAAYQRLVLIFDLGTMGDGSADFTFLFDDIELTSADNDGGGDGVSENAPEIPVDFESATLDYTFSGFGGGETTVIDNPQSNGINTSANVAQMVKNPGEIFGGTFIDLATPIDFSVNTTFKIKVNAPRAFAKLLLKVENLANGAISFEKEATVIEANIWEELSFDFSAIDKSNSYQRLVFIFDLGVEGDGSANFTYLFDDILLVEDDGTGGEDQTQMDLPVTFDESGIDYGLVSFEGAAAVVVDDPTDNSNRVAQVVKDENAQAVAGTTLTALAGNGFKNPVPFTATETFMSVRVWSPDAGIPVRLKVENSRDPSQSVEAEMMTSLAGDWETLTYDFSDQANGTAALNLSFTYDKATIFFNFLVDGATAGSKTYYFDDMVFGTVEKSDQTITFDDLADRTLGDAPFTLSATASSGLAVSYTVSDQLTLDGSEVAMVAAGRATITATQSGNNSFNAAPEVSKNFCIAPAMPVITSGTAGTSITLNSSSASGNQWFLDGVAISGATAATYEAQTSGDYTLQVTVDDCVSAVSDELSLLVTSTIDDPTQSLNVFPNPVTDYLEIKGLLNAPDKVQMLNMSGADHAVVFEKISESYRAYVGHLVAGVYILNVQAGSKVYQIKVLKR